MDWIDLKGNNYEVGFQVGDEWGKRLRTQSIYWRAVRKRISQELSWSRAMRSLMANVIREFPDIAEEIDGMAQGARHAGFETSFVDIFACALGETSVAHCSSFVVRTEQSLLLAHNEEDEGNKHRCPLLFAQVTLKTGGRSQIKFVSASYPFQLLGSSVGMNGGIAFQGNSIGYAGSKKRMLNETLGSRVPHTVLTRKMLELRDVASVEDLLERHHSTLPRHHFICDERNVYSVEVRPIDPRLPRQPKQYQCRSVDLEQGNAVGHTNHFVNGREWNWPSVRKRRESVKRLSALKTFLGEDRPRSPKQALETLKRHRAKYEAQTLASIVFEVSRGQSKCFAEYYSEIEKLRTVALRSRR